MSIIAANGATALRVKEIGVGVVLKSRVLSALFLAPFFLGVIYLGGPVFVCVVAIIAGVMTTEWRQISNNGEIDYFGYFAISIVVGVVALAFLSATHWALMVLCVGTFVLWVQAKRRIGNPGGAGIWVVPGVLAIGCMGIGLIWLREVDSGGFYLVLWLIVAIWMTDICALFVGRFLGGPKLAPTISPNKTWSGLFGGIAGAALWSSIWSYWTDTGTILALAIIGGGTAVLAQLGDLSVSVVKRRFGAKDTGNLIPGHGGLLDRMDGFLGAVPVVALSLAISKGDISQWS